MVTLSCKASKKENKHGATVNNNYIYIYIYIGAEEAYRSSVAVNFIISSKVASVKLTIENSLKIVFKLCETFK